MTSPELQQINETLRGPVIDLLTQQVPAFALMSPARIYEAIMDSPELADGCFKIFRKKQELFADLLVGTDGQPVTRDTQMLRCGRSLAEVVTLIVRAVAKRYFRAHVGSRALRRVRRRRRRLPFIQRVWIFLGLREPPRPRRRPRISPADELYAAIRDFLIYEWQVPLIPHYAPLSAAVVTRVGPMLLTLRRPEEIKALMAMPEEPLPAVLAPRPGAGPSRARPAPYRLPAGKASPADGQPALQPVARPGGIDMAGLAAGYRSGRERRSSR